MYVEKNYYKLLGNPLNCIKSVSDCHFIINYEVQQYNYI